MPGSARPPVDYPRFVQDVRLLSIVAQDVRWRIRKGPQAPSALRVTPILKPPTYHVSGNRFNVEYADEVRAHAENSKAQSAQSAWFSIRATMIIAYEVNAATILWNERPEFEQFVGMYASTSGVLHMWPYFRELCSSATGRMGLPPFFLDTRVILPPRG